MSCLSQYEQAQARFAHHRALILQILNKHPQGLTHQQIRDLEKEWYGYGFTTDNRLRELRKLGYVESVEGQDGILYFCNLMKAWYRYSIILNCIIHKEYRHSKSLREEERRLDKIGTSILVLGFSIGIPMIILDLE